jgi:hypothetical protein
VSYIGNTPTTQNFIAGTDQFTGNGSSTNFTLSRFVNSTNDIEVVIANVVQNPTSYSVSGNTLTISPAVANGVVFYVRYLSTTLQSITVPGGSAVNGTFLVAQDTYLATTSGNVGVGTTSPSAYAGYTTLTIDNATNGGVVDLKINGVRTGSLTVLNSNFNINNPTAGAVTVFTNGGERMRIGPSGQIGLSGANYGTSGQVLTSQGSGSAPVWGDAGGMTLLGTLTTTSGTTAVLSGLNLTSYKAIFISINRCSHTSGSNQEFQLLDANGSTYLSINPATAASAFVSGICQISLINGAIASNIGTNATSATPLVDSPSGTVAGITTFSTSATSFTFRFAAGNFDNGSISVYGVK